MNLREAIPNFFWGRDAKKAVEPIEYPRTPTPYEYIRSIPKIGRTPDKVTSILTTGHPRIIGAAEFDPKLFESKSFRIDSSNWREVTFPDGTRAKIHPKYDVTELLDGPYAGEQHFSFDAMLRETRNLWKRVMNAESWLWTIRTINPSIETGNEWHNDSSVRKTLGIRLSGYRGLAPWGFWCVGDTGGYWIPSSCGKYGYVANFTSGQILPLNPSVRALGFSVLCLRD